MDARRGRDPPVHRAGARAGINFFDTANVYSAGSSEEILGRALATWRDRDEIVIATKVHGPMRKGPNGGGLSRKAILTEIDDSLRRLGTDYVDLYQIHRWDSETPIEETLEALHDVVRAGKARYIGASSMCAWQFAKALAAGERHGWARFVSMQNHYNLLYREEEREMLPLCADRGHRRHPLEPARPRPADPALGRRDRARRDRRVRQDPLPRRGRATIVERVLEIAERRGVSRAQVALAWVLANPAVTAPIVGVTKPDHLDDAVAGGRPRAHRGRDRRPRGALPAPPDRRPRLSVPGAAPLPDGSRRVPSTPPLRPQSR